jgi:hypothetical protein
MIIGEAMAQKVYKNHVALRDKLKRLGKVHTVIGKSYSALSTLVFDTALVKNGYLPKESYYGSPFEQPGLTYKDWIEQLKRAGVLAPFKDEDKTMEKSDWIRFKPGPITLPYVNKEKAHQQEMASMRDVYESEARMDARKADRTEVQDLKARMNEIAEAVQKLQIASAPPDSEEKREIRKEVTNRLGQLVVKN